MPATRPRPVLVTLRDPRVRLAVLLALLASAGLAVWTVGVPQPEHVRSLLTVDTLWAPLLPVLAAAVLAMLLFPRAGVAILAGLLFPPALAVGYVLVGTVLGAAIAFGIGRILGRPFLAQLTAGRVPEARLCRLQAWLDRRGTLGVLYTRIIPVLPFGLLNYTFGATRVRLGAFVVGTTLGILPNTILNVFLGASVTDPTSPRFFLAAGGSVLAAAAGTLVMRRTDRRSEPAPEQAPVPVLAGVR
jgi:uncharacterized membrane protein YdjX (TVP38/TMEM64 family)